MTRRREFEKLLEEVEEIEAQRDTAIGVVADADVSDDDVETLIQASHKRLAGGDLDEEEGRALRRADAVDPA